MVALGLAIERVVLRPLVNQPQITLFMATIGLAFFIEGLAQLLWGSQVHGLELGIEDVPIAVADRTTSNITCQPVRSRRPRSWPACWSPRWRCSSSKTRIGRALRAVADDHQAALAVGIPLQQIWAIVWAVAGFVALVAGLLWGARNGVQFALTFVALKALPVLILGGFDSIPGAIVGGLIIGATREAGRGLSRPDGRRRHRRLVRRTCWRCCSCWSGPKGCSARNIIRRHVTGASDARFRL